ncbi:cytochrome P450 [Dendrothele bispora CBS 962.96]|uniref:Cytochrome P450 n=1 Tax=Dendrothele bispora (strain CBS 962.96) TaxID=1314807 RepID=A0A4V4HAN5_DENBC|nr:cytochrome P450 [Dendrothele bispora CBS 962.96]
MTLLWQGFTTAVVCLVALYSFRKRARTYPPGPRGVPILGNLFQVNTANPWTKFREWAKIYGPIVYVNIAGQSIVLLNTKKAAEDLLEYRGSKYSDRPRLIALEYMGGNSLITMLSLGDRWRRLRRASEHALGAKISSNYHGIQTNESTLMAHGLLTEPEKWNGQLQRMSSSIILSILYGKPIIQSVDDPSVVFMNELVEAFCEATVPGTYLVVFPILEHLPRWLSRWKQVVEKRFQIYDSRFHELFLSIKKKVISGQEQCPSFSFTLAENQARHGTSDRDCSWSCGAL